MTSESIQVYSDCTEVARNPSTLFLLSFPFTTLSLSLSLSGFRMQMRASHCEANRVSQFHDGSNVSDLQTGHTSTCHPRTHPPIDLSSHLFSRPAGIPINSIRRVPRFNEFSSLFVRLMLIKRLSERGWTRTHARVMWKGFKVDAGEDLVHPLFTCAERSHPP